MKWFDGHLDLAYMAGSGRDLRKSAADCGGVDLPAAVTFAALAAGNVRGTLGTIFIAKRRPEEKGTVEDRPWSFDTPEEAGRAARAQLETYRRWAREGLIVIATQDIKRETRDMKHETRNERAGEPLTVVLMMEGASGVNRVEEMDEFYAAGVRVVSLTWAAGSQWSGGNDAGGDVTEAGRKLLARIDALGMIHDVSHLSDQAFWTVMKEAKGIKVATHSNCRALVPDAKSPERHLSDAQIRALAEAGGIVALNLYTDFLVAEGATPWRRATVADVVRHIGHMEKVAGRRDFLALGTDMDGGFSRNKCPVGLEGPEHLHRLAEGLRAAGWSEAEIERFAWGNWAEVLAKVGVRV